MHLERLHIHDFRNYANLDATFGQGVNCLLGKNGSGKTNLLDAIYYLSFTKSSLTATDTQNIKTSAPMFVIRGTFCRDALSYDVSCSFKPGSKKMVMENAVEYNKLSQHVGRYPVVLIAPNDIELIWDGGEVRRKFFDSLLSQIDRDYLDQLITYHAHLKMRNSMLRLFGEKGKVDHDLLEGCDLQLVATGTFIAARRKTFTGEFAPIFLERYGYVSNEMKETAAIRYVTEIDEQPLGDLLKKNLERDILLQRTTAGVHRDDFEFLLDGFELKRYGSQGQQKSFLIGLKLAEFEAIRLRKGFKPVLLLDDIFDKLDDHRISRLVGMMNDHTFGQLFLTDARPDRTLAFLSGAGISADTFSVENGTLQRRA